MADEANNPSTRMGVEYDFSDCKPKMAYENSREVLRRPIPTSSESSGRSKCCIYRVPWCLRGQGNDNDFRPRLVSIGPYHFVDPQLRPMQLHKYRILDCILKRTGKDLNQFLNVTKNLDDDARACYENFPEATFSSEAFAKILLLDACFILEFLVGGFDETQHYGKLGYQYDDPIFSKGYMRRGILMDMMLLENQTPLFVLNQVYEVQFNQPHNNKVVDLMYKAFNPKWVIGRPLMSETGEKQFLTSSKLQNKGYSSPSSCLEVFWQTLMHDFSTNECKRNTVQGRGNQDDMAPEMECMDTHNIATPDMAIRVDNEPQIAQETMLLETETRMAREVIWHVVESPREAAMIGERGKIPGEYGNAEIERPGNEENVMDLEQHVVRSVIALKEAGVVFKHKTTTPFWDVKFEAGVLEIPQIAIVEWPESMFLNLMAFELCHIEETKHKILWYILFMDSLVNSAADVDELRASGVIVSTGMSDKELARVFNRMGRKPVTMQPRDQELIKALNKYCSKRTHRWRANLMHNYFNNPWAIISVVAAAFLMLLTVVQTFYSIVPYYTNP